MGQPTVNSSQDYGPKGFRWLTLKRIKWTDPRGKTRFWESAERRNRASSGVDGVAVIARVSSSSSPPRIIIISQYRPPVNAYCLELPAGLVDEGETAGIAALRELKEETGYTGRLLSVTPLCVSDPGMTNANMQVAIVEVDLDTPENAAANVEQALHDGEFIAVELAPWNKLLSWLLEKKDRDGCEIDARLFTFAMGLHEERIEALAEAESEAAAAGSVDIAVPFGSPAAVVGVSGPGGSSNAVLVISNNRRTEEGRTVVNAVKDYLKGTLDLMRSPGYTAGLATAAGALVAHLASRRRQ